MKKLYIIILLLMPCFAICQITDSSKVHIKAKILEGSSGYTGLYKDSNLQEKAALYNNIAGKIFSVQSSHQYINSEYKYRTKMKIYNSEIGELFFDYNTEFGYDSYFDDIYIPASKKVVAPKIDYCIYIDSTFDKFTKVKTYDAAVNDNIQLLKYKTAGKPNTTVLYITTYGSTLTYGKGVTLLLDKDKKIERPLEKVDVKVGDNGGYIYSAFMVLTLADIKLLSTYKLTDTRLYIHDDTVEEGDKLQQLLKCMAKK